jgi:cytidylate kinase
MSEIFKIAIDGPGGAGKSTVAKAVAKKLKIEYIDTGAMYRALALKMMRENVPPQDCLELRKVLNETQIDFSDGHIFLDGENISNLIRTPEVSMAASEYSAIPFVREKLVEAQQKMGESKSVIMDGRDIGTVVFPDAKYKYFITADAEERAKRRYEELMAKGEEAVFEDVLKDIQERDSNDRTREASPLKQAEDAQVIDTTNMSVEDAVSYICSKVQG